MDDGLVASVITIKAESRKGPVEYEDAVAVVLEPLSSIELGEDRRPILNRGATNTVLGCRESSAVGGVLSVDARVDHWVVSCSYIFSCTLRCADHCLSVFEL